MTEPPMSYNEFTGYIMQKGRELYRDMPWRSNTGSYYVLVSEIMLQQTQVDRVIPKFLQFMQEFPTIEALHRAALGEVLGVWSGLGYNRRAKYLHDAANVVAGEYGGLIPNTAEALITLPGVGANTAGAILAYAFNQPSVFIETNIRTVYIHHYFSNTSNIDDKEILQVLEKTLDKNNPREFYWALMDYGSLLKSQGLGLINRSKHYAKQPPLKGSIREVRGQIVKALIGTDQSLPALKAAVGADQRFLEAYNSLLKDGLVQCNNGVVGLLNYHKRSIG